MTDSPWLLVAAIGLLLVVVVAVVTKRHARPADNTGVEPDPVVCPRCKGVGKVRHPSYGGDDWVVCKRCGGKGTVPGGRSP